MPATNKKEDLRYIKTENAILSAMTTLLEKNNFRKITVDDICDKALIGRATFYAHFNDKYDLMRYCLDTLRKGLVDRYDSFDKMERLVNEYIRENGNIIRNLVDGADDETLMILSDFMRANLQLTSKNDSGKIDHRHIVFSEFYIGGLLRYLSWQVKNKFPPDVSMMNESLYKLIETYWKLVE